MTDYFLLPQNNKQERKKKKSEFFLKILCDGGNEKAGEGSLKGKFQ